LDGQTAGGLAGLNAGWLAGTRIAVCNRCDIMPVRQVQGKAKVQLVRPLYPKPKALFLKAFAILVKHRAGQRGRLDPLTGEIRHTPGIIGYRAGKFNREKTRFVISEGCYEPQGGYENLWEKRLKKHHVLHAHQQQQAAEV